MRQSIDKVFMQVLFVPALEDEGSLSGQFPRISFEKNANLRE